MDLICSFLTFFKFIVHIYNNVYGSFLYLCMEIDVLYKQYETRR